LRRPLEPKPSEWGQFELTQPPVNKNSSSSSISQTTTSRTAGTPHPVQRGYAVAVSLDAWTAQQVRVLAYGGGDGDSRIDQPYVAVTVGECLTYVYDHEALASHLAAWQRAAKQNTVARLPAAPDRSTHPTGQEMVVLCNTAGRQRHVVTAETDTGGRRALSVVVGAVTVRVHTTEALRCYLHAWTRAAALAGIFDPPVS